MTCKNRDMPAMPAARERDIEIYDDIPSGLTKREYFAVLAMQALLSATDETGTWKGLDCAAQAVSEAEALLAELEKTQ